MRRLTKKFGKMLYRDGPMIVATMLFASLFVTHVGDMTS
jgi:hypothetical protein